MERRPAILRSARAPGARVGYRRNRRRMEFPIILLVPNNAEDVP
jgi:hypothetical protein